MKTIQQAAKSILDHDGIYAVTVVHNDNEEFSDCKFTERRVELLHATSDTLRIYKRLRLTKPARFVFNDDHWGGAMSIVATEVDGRLIALAVRTGHEVCKSVMRMIRRGLRNREAAPMRPSMEPMIP